MMECQLVQQDRETGVGFLVAGLSFREAFMAGYREWPVDAGNKRFWIYCHEGRAVTELLALEAALRTFAIYTQVEINDDNIDALSGAVQPDTDELAAATAANVVADEIDTMINDLSDLRDFVTVIRHDVIEVHQ